MTESATPRWTDQRHLKQRDRFDTPFENGCEVLVAPGEWDPDRPSTFLALDSDLVVSEFDTIMVVGHPDHRFFHKGLM